MAAPVYILNDNDYLELEAVKRTTRIPANITKYDQDFIAIIKAASRMLDEYTGREWYYKADRLERYAPGIGNYFFLQSCPVISIVSITEVDSGSEIAEADIDIESPKTGTIFIRRGLIRSGVRNPGILGTTNEKLKRNNYRIVYESGYETPTQSGTGAETLPWHVRQTLLEVCAHMFLSRSENLNVKREHLLEAAYWYDHSNALKILNHKLAKHGRVKQA